MASRELKWLGYLLVREGILEPDECRELGDVLGGDPDFVDYAQAVIDEELADDFELLQNLVDQAFSKGEGADDPPVDIFRIHAPPPPTVAEDPSATEEPPATGGPAKPPVRLRMSSDSVAPKTKPKPAADPDGSAVVLADAEQSRVMSRQGLTLSGGSGGSKSMPTPPKPKARAVPLGGGGRPAPPKPSAGAEPEAELEPPSPPSGPKKIPFRKKSEAPSPVEPSLPPGIEAPPGEDAPDLVFDVDEAAAPRPAAKAAPKAKAADSPEGHGGGRPQVSLGNREQVSMPRVSGKGGAMPKVNSAIGKSPAEAGEILARILVGVREMGASDLHLSAKAKPFYRRNMGNEFLEDEVVDPRAAEALNLALLSASQRELFLAEQDLDYSLALDDHNRFRVNLMQHKQGCAGTYRLVPNSVQRLEELGFTTAHTITELLNHHNGLILVTGPVGSGKTTTLAALVQILNETRHDHVITVEDPIEIVQSSKNCNVTQRQVGMHTRSFFTALKGALREDPDIIVIGELRDLETIEMAITAAETGHLVIGTLHTSDASTTLNRVLDVFPPAQQAQIRSMTAESLRGIVCQKLLPTVDGTVAVAEELLIGTIAVGNIIRDGKMHQLRAVLETGSAMGMCTMDQSIERLLNEGRITPKTAMANVMESTLRQRISAMEARDAGGAAATPGAADKKKKGWFR